MISPAMVVPTIIHPLKEAAGTIEGYCMQEPPVEKRDNEKQNRVIDGIGGGVGALAGSLSASFIFHNLMIGIAAGVLVGCCAGVVLNWIWRR
ncbi:hypothetical protein [Phyllobacterium myrsinacearum]|nr:hypothetical protein [Phyllobacterium myrsinacearum]